jgi:hypothetical protein
MLLAVTVIHFVIHMEVLPDGGSFKIAYILLYSFKCKCICNMIGNTVKNSLNITDTSIICFVRIRMIRRLTYIALLVKMSVFPVE